MEKVAVTEKKISSGFIYFFSVHSVGFYLDMILV